MTTTPKLTPELAAALGQYIPRPDTLRSSGQTPERQQPRQKVVVSEGNSKLLKIKQ
jgi:hypothetical protein